MKKYTFELVIYEGSDEFWDANPSDKEVTAEIADCLFDRGFYVTENIANTELKLIKFELLKDDLPL